MEIRQEDLVLKDITNDDFKYVISLYINCSKYDYAFGINKEKSIKEIYRDLNGSNYDKESINMIIEYRNIKVGIIRFYISEINSNQLWINYIIIEEKFQNMGIGKRVVKLFECYFHKKYSVNIALISVVKDNKNGIIFWLKNDYKIVSILKEHVKINNSLSDIILMKKELNFFEL